jgi:hypothetical protein
MPQAVALIADIVRSRNLIDRVGAHDDIMSAFRAAHATFRVEWDIWATAGDEFQAVYPSVAAMLAVTALVRLKLPPTVDCRFGVGQGEVLEIDRRPDGAPIQDGSAWWQARAAIERAHKQEDHGHPYLRTWFVANGHDEEGLVNAYLHQRDFTISRMKARERRVAAGMLQGRPQSRIATDEGITQPAVSQMLQRSGATALAAGFRLLEDRYLQ